MERLFAFVVQAKPTASDLVPSLLQADVPVSCVTGVDLLQALLRAGVIGAVGVEAGPQPNELMAQTAALLRQQPRPVPLHVISHADAPLTGLAGNASHWCWPRDKARLIQTLQADLTVGAPGASTPPGPAHPGASLRHELKGAGAAMRAVGAEIEKAAAVDSNVLITGETGTGKGLAAEWIHRLSRRKRHELVHVNCAAIPDTLLESELFGHKKGAFTGADRNRPGKLRHAHRGTLFLDEVGDMPLAGQAKILRAIESQSVQPLGDESTTAVDVRLVAATNQNLYDLMERGSFRTDLFYRLNVVHIHLPLLSERPEDIPCIAQHFVEVFNGKFDRNITGLSQPALDALLNYPWPGNVRELRNAIEVAFVNQPGEEVGLTDLPSHIAAAGTVVASPDNELCRLMSALTATHWNKTKAAERLNWSRMTLYRKLKKYSVG